jgi:nickel transport protein
MLLDRKPRRSWGATLTVLALGIVVALPMVSHVWAHKVNVFAWVEGDTVFVEGYFPGGKKSQDSLVEVFNSAGTKLLEGRTNKKGEFSFKIPEKTDLKIILTSSMGHKNDFIVPASNFQEVESSPSSPAQSFAESARDSSAHPADLSQLEGMIDKALDRKRQSSGPETCPGDQTHPRHPQRGSHYRGNRGRDRIYFRPRRSGGLF